MGCASNGLPSECLEMLSHGNDIGNWPQMQPQTFHGLEPPRAAAEEGVLGMVHARPVH